MLESPLPEAPAALVECCQRAGMPLFEVPYRVPFIAVVRFAADLIAEAAHARESWSLATQRAISFAALRPDPLPSILRELSRDWGSLGGAVRLPRSTDRVSRTN